MCPLRLILIFLSASVAGFLVLKGLKSKPDLQTPNDDDSTPPSSSQHDSSSPPPLSKAISAISSGFWICVDMASGRYLWRNLSPKLTSKER